MEGPGLTMGPKGFDFGHQIVDCDQSCSDSLNRAQKLNDETNVFVSVSSKDIWAAFDATQLVTV